jgi:hypothetical protein
MPWSGGVYTFPSNSWNPSVSGAAISSTDWNETAADLEAGLSDAINKDGQSTTTAAIPFAQGITLGAGTDVLTAYDEGTWTPTITYTTPGTASATYSDQSGQYVRIGKLVLAIFQVVFTPTLGTASGVVLIDGLPITAAATGNQSAAGPRTINNSFTMPGGYSQYGFGLASTTQLGLFVFGSGATSGGIGPANMTSGAVHSLAGSIWYRAA